ncbi:hypothetical protein KDE13_09135 [Campylobacter sp. faydin G-140]|uniref:hypothetical protein n=1 Tax=Campylobacter anatolicus TaxID=2829105 RepID=UPI001B96C810|nr:hypothetical protein [Campylobacter anatolicus]MBR8466497.1 hypothetical protein [Campylobacter anatolicus]
MKDEKVVVRLDGQERILKFFGGLFFAFIALCGGGLASIMIDDKWYWSAGFLILAFVLPCVLFSLDKFNACFKGGETYYKSYLDEMSKRQN